MFTVGFRVYKGACYCYWRVYVGFLRSIPACILSAFLGILKPSAQAAGPRGRKPERANHGVGGGGGGWEGGWGGGGRVGGEVHAWEGSNTPPKPETLNPNTTPTPLNTLNPNPKP